MRSMSRLVMVGAAGWCALAPGAAQPGESAGLAAGAGDQNAGRPHIVYILADDMGYGDVQRQNPESRIPTPNLDRLAGEGRRFTDAHTTSSVCTPTRYSILTGRYNWRSRLKSGVLYPPSKPLVEGGRMTVPSLLKQHGYHTAVVGKWHLGLGWQMKGGTVDWSKPLTAGPNTLGFDHSFIVPGSLDMSPYCYVVDHRIPDPPTQKVAGDVFGRGGVRTPGLTPGQVLGDLTRHSAEVIEKHARNRAGQPLFLYFPLTAPHTPVAPSEAFRGRTDSAYGDFVVEVDWVVGEVCRALEAAGMADNTLLIFTADNGASPRAAASAIRRGHAPNRPFRGGKSTIWEGGHRVPFIVRWPAQIKAGTVCDQTVSTADLMATCAELAGAELAADAGEDSFSMLPLLRREVSDQPIRPCTVHHSINGTFAIRKGPWKLIPARGGGGWDESDWGLPRVPIDKTAPMQLYNLAADPGETTNLHDKHPDVADDLLKELTRVVNRGRSTLGKPQRNDGGGYWPRLNWMKRHEYTNADIGGE